MPYEVSRSGPQTWNIAPKHEQLSRRSQSNCSTSQRSRAVLVNGNTSFLREYSTSALAWVIFVAGWSWNSTSTEASSAALGILAKHNRRLVALYLLWLRPSALE